MATLRTDLSLVQLPSTTPNFGGLLGKNTVQTDPNFSTKIVRLTDASISKNMSLQTADAAQAGLWNANDTLFLARNTESTSFLFQFDPTTMQGTLLPYSYVNIPVSFSKKNSNVLFTLNGTVVNQLTFKKVSGTFVYQSTTEICDFAKILPTGFKPAWTSAFVQSQDDSTFSVGFSSGVQNTGIYACIWQSGHGTIKGYRMLNTNTGVITGGWGATGTASLSSAKTKFPFTLHEVYGVSNKGYTLLTPGNASDSQLVWNNASNSIIDDAMTGHEAHGNLNIYAGGPGGGQLAVASYATPTTHSMLLPPASLPASLGQKYIGDRHWQFGKISATDESIIWSSGAGVTPPALFVSAWQNEVTGYDTVAKVVYRACHTFSTNKSTQFIVANSIAVPSQTGKFVAFTSDMMGTLGGTDGSTTGTIGSTARGDVFIVNVG